MYMSSKSTLTLLRIPFSFFLMPVYLFALSEAAAVDWKKAALVFVTLHLLVYPSSNGYNSYMDRDEGAIGLLERPPAPTRELFKVTVLLDILALVLGMAVGAIFAASVAAMIVASHAYSYRGIRLKKYPLTGFLTVVLFQGCLVFFMVYQGAALGRARSVPWQGMLASGLFFGGFYPLTQIYQHEQDLRDGVRTLSYTLGLRGTFVFSALCYLAAEAVLYAYLVEKRPFDFYLLQVCMVPIAICFIIWWIAVAKDPGKADYRHAMRMAGIAATCMNMAFLGLTVIHACHPHARFFLDGN